MKLCCDYMIVKDLSKLKHYGFKREKSELDFLQGKYVYNLYTDETDNYLKPIRCLYVFEKDKELHIDRCYGLALRVLCEMYKDNIVEFIDSDEYRKRRKV